MKPTIGITTPGRDADGKHKLNADYVDAVRRAGGLALALPPGGEDLAQIIELCDGFVMTGGGDVDPLLYGGREHAEIYGVDARRDASEIELARAIVARKVPALCICRGLQVLNVALGGTLVEHVPDEFGERVLHRGGGVYQLHEVDVLPTSRLARALGATRCAPACWHHQAVRDPGDGLTVVARAADGVVEALEHATHEHLWAVQWHPEHTAATDATQQALFDALVTAARRARSERRALEGVVRPR